MKKTQHCEMRRLILFYVGINSGDMERVLIDVIEYEKYTDVSSSHTISSKHDLKGE